MSWMPSADPMLGDKRSCDTLELVVVPRVRDLGNGFAVRRAMPNDKRQLVGPFIFFDQMGPVQFLAGQGTDVRYGTIVTRRLRAMGIRDKPTAPASPWQNGFAERLIGSIRRECVDHFVVLGEAHLRRSCEPMLAITTTSERTGRWTKIPPVSRPVQRTGMIGSHAILGGLHHGYVRV